MCYWVTTRSVLVSFPRCRSLALLLRPPLHNSSPHLLSPSPLLVQCGKERRMFRTTARATKKVKEAKNVVIDGSDLSHILWWQEKLHVCKKPSTVQLIKRLVFTNLLGVDDNLRNGSLKEGTLNWEMLHFKSRFPHEVLLCRVGDFYEAIGIDACILVEYAGLNPFGGLRTDSIPRAGCPVVNLRQTLDDLTRNGHSVCIVEEVQGPVQARSRKGRFISGHAHPGSPYVYGLIAADHDLEFPEPMPVVGISRSAKGNPLTVLFSKVMKDLYGLEDEIMFRNVTVISESRPRPLHLSTATQIGIPCIMKVLLPSNCTGLPTLYVRDLLLNPPSYEIASKIQAICRLMSDVTCSIPEFTCVSIGKVERAAESLSLAISEDFLPIISRIRAHKCSTWGSKGEILYAREHDAVWFKGKRFSPAIWAGTPGEEQIKQLKPALDSKGRKVGEEWFTTARVENALTGYHEASAKAKTRVIELLRVLSGQLQTKINILVFASMLLVIAKALFAHVSEGRRRKWVFPSLTEFSLSKGRERTGGSTDGLILNGPNGGGKSSLLRSICAASLLGICGFMVPAEHASIPNFDSIMLHMKSYDSPADCKSSFQIEMSEMRSLITEATAKSLVRWMRYVAERKQRKGLVSQEVLLRLSIALGVWVSCQLIYMESSHYR
ncbi:unnamed protein product [Rhodiola kirilowii]